MFRLAGHLSKSVAWIEENISSKELIEWLAFYECIEPFGGRLIEEQRSYLSFQMAKDKDKLLKEFYLYDYDTRTPEQIIKEELEIEEAKAIEQANTMKRFFKKKTANNTK